jgi:hypothetical protein
MEIVAILDKFFKKQRSVARIFALLRIGSFDSNDWFKRAGTAVNGNK